jgi:hypothetical protein
MSTARTPREFILYPTALMMSGLWCFGLLCFDRIMVGRMVEWFVFALSFWSPSSVASMDCYEWSSCMVVISTCICDLKSFTGLFPRYMLRIGHLPPLRVWRSTYNSLNVLLMPRGSEFCVVFAPFHEVCAG